MIDRGAHVAGSEDRDTCRDIPFSSAACVPASLWRAVAQPCEVQKLAHCAYPTISSQCRYFDKCTNWKPRLHSFGSAAWTPSAVPRSGRFMCAKMIEPGVLLSIVATTWAAE